MRERKFPCPDYRALFRDSPHTAEPWTSWPHSFRALTTGRCFATTMPCGCESGSCYWFPCPDYRALFRVSMTTVQVKLTALFPCPDYRALFRDLSVKAYLRGLDLVSVP